MPTLEELYRQQISATPSTPHTPLASAAGFGKGLAINFPLTVLKGIGAPILNAAQALTGVGMYGATDPTPEFSDIPQRLRNLGDAATLGLAGTYKQHLDKASEVKPPVYAEDVVTNAAGALTDTVVQDILPGREISALIRGVDENGVPVSPEMAGEMVGLGVMKTALLGKGIGKGQSTFGEKLGGVEGLGKVDPRLARKVAVREGVLKRYADGVKAEAALNQLAIGEEISSGGKKGVTSLQDRLLQETGLRLKEETTPESGKFSAESGQFSTPLLDQVFEAALNSKITRSVFERMSAEGTPMRWTDRVYQTISAINDSAVEFRRSGKGYNPLGPDDSFGRLGMRISKEYGIPIEEVAPAIGETLLRTMSMWGDKGRVASQALDRTVGRLLMTAEKGGEAGLEAIKTLQSIEKANALSAKGTTLWGRMTSFLNKDVEGVRRGLLVGQLTTAIRNFRSQGLTALLEVPELAIANTLEAMVGKWYLGEGKNWSSYFGDTLNHLGTVYNEVYGRFKKGGLPSDLKRFEGFEEVLSAVPLVKRELLGNVSWEVANSVMWDVVKARKIVGLGKAMKEVGPHSIPEAAHMMADLVNIPNRLQETFFRRLSFQSRLMSNMERLGVDGFGETLEILRSPDNVRPELTTIPKGSPKGTLSPLEMAFGDALEHSLKQTYAYTPNGGLAGGILDFYKKMPLSTAILPTFPRFLFNQWRWQLEHSPTIWFNMFESKFRQALVSGAEHGFVKADAYRALARATTGSLMLSAAWTMRNSPGAGPKYYLWKPQPYEMAQRLVDTTPGKQQMVDFRPDQPFVTFLFLADLIRSVKNDQPLNLDSNEFLDATVGVRRISEVEVFALTDQLRSLDSSDPETWQRALKTPLGQYFASFFVPLNTLKELYEGVSGDSLPYRDVERQELVGPTLASLHPSSLPERINPFTGEAMRAYHPIAHQVGGVTVKELSPLEEMVMGVPGLRVSDLTGDYNDPTAQGLVHARIGDILQTPIRGGTLEEMIVSLGKDLPLPIRTEYLKQIMTSIRQSAVGMAQQQNPFAFLEKKAKDLPPIVREDARTLFRTLRHDYEKQSQSKP